MKTFDIHQHVNFQATDGVSQMEEDYDARIRILDANGIDKAAISTSQYYYRPRGIYDTKKINDLIAEYTSKYHDRFPVGFGTVEPFHGEESIDEIDRVIKDLGLKGLCWHHMSLGCCIDHPMMYEYLRKLETYNLPALIHIFAEAHEEEPWRLIPMAEAHPNVNIVALAGLWSYSRIDLMIYVMKKYANVFVDSNVFPWSLVIERIVDEVGDDRLLLGSNLLPVPKEAGFHHCHSLYEIRQSPSLSDEQKKKICYENAQQLLNILK